VPDEAPLSVDATIEGDTARVTLRGELDLDRAGALAEELAALGRPSATGPALNMCGLSNVTASMQVQLAAARRPVARVVQTARGGAWLALPTS